MTAFALAQQKATKPHERTQAAARRSEPSHSSTLTTNELAQLDNNALQVLLRVHAIQPKLKIGSSNDQYEREADRVADEILRMPDIIPQLSSPRISALRSGESVRRMCASCEEEHQNISGQIQRMCEKCEPRSLSLGDTVMRLSTEGEERQEDAVLQRTHRQTNLSPMSPRFGAALSSLRSGGRPLSIKTREFMEPRFNQDLSGVRLHEGPAATRLAAQIGARAFTIGTDIVLGQKAPSESVHSRQLLAHELTHVIQQQGGTSERPRIGNSLVQSTSNQIQRSMDPECGRQSVLRVGQPVCSRPASVSSGTWSSRLGHAAHRMIQDDFVRDDRANNLKEVPIPGGNECRGDFLDPGSRQGRADMVKVVRRDENEIQVQIGEIKPMQYSTLGDGERQLICYKDQIREVGRFCRDFGRIGVPITRARRGIGYQYMPYFNFCEQVGAIRRGVERGQPMQGTLVTIANDPIHYMRRVWPQVDIGGRRRLLVKRCLSEGVIGYSCLEPLRDDDDGDPASAENGELQVHVGQQAGIPTFRFSRRVSEIEARIEIWPAGVEVAHPLAPLAERREFPTYEEWIIAPEARSHLQLDELRLRMRPDLQAQVAREAGGPIRSTGTQQIPDWATRDTRAAVDIAHLLTSMGQTMTLVFAGTPPFDIQILWIRNGTHIQIYQGLPTDLAYYRQLTNNDTHVARLLQQSADQINTDMYDLVVGEGIAPSRAQTILRQAYRQVLLERLMQLVDLLMTAATVGSFRNMTAQRISHEVRETELRRQALSLRTLRLVRAAGARGSTASGTQRTRMSLQSALETAATSSHTTARPSAQARVELTQDVVQEVLGRARRGYRYTNR